MVSYQTELEAKVALINEVNAEINRLTPLVLAAFTPLVGQKLFKESGGFYEKFKHLAPRSDKNFQIFRDLSSYRLAFTVKSSKSVVKGNYEVSTYYEGTIDVGELTCFEYPAGVLKNIRPFQPLKCDYAVDDVLKARKDVDLAKDALYAAQSKLGPFGEY